MLFIKYVLFEVKGFIRQPTYIVSTLVFPSVFFLFFAQPNIKNEHGARLILGSFSAYAILSVVFYQFAVNTAMERESGWFFYLKTLPVRALEVSAAKSCCGFLFALLSVTLLHVVIVFSTDLPGDLSLYGKNLLASLVFGAPFCWFGQLIGTLVSSRSAVPISNLVYLPLSFAGGLWLPPEALPHSVAKVSQFLPTRSFGELMWWAGNPNISWPSQYFIKWVIYSVLFLLLYFVVTSKSFRLFLRK